MKTQIDYIELYIDYLISGNGLWDHCTTLKSHLVLFLKEIDSIVNFEKLRPILNSQSWKIYFKQLKLINAISQNKKFPQKLLKIQFKQY